MLAYVCMSMKFQLVFVCLLAVEPSSDSDTAEIYAWDFRSRWALADVQRAKHIVSADVKLT